MVDETIDDQLSGNDADEGHVVARAERLALAALVDQAGNR
jgi:hypothetical protein